MPYGGHSTTKSASRPDTRRLKSVFRLLGLHLVLHEFDFSVGFFQVRYASLAAIRSLAEKLGEEYMTLLPETIPFLAELMEGG